MSRKIAALVYSRKAGSVMRKALLAYMAERASDDGSGIWASKQRIALEIEASRRSVISNIQSFVDEGILIEVGKKKHKNGWTMEYKLSVELIAALPVSDPEDPCKIAHVEAEDVKELHPTREGASRQDVKELHTNRPRTVLEPSDTDVSDTRDAPEHVSEQPKPNRAASPRGSARGSRIPQNWTPSPEDYAYASKLGLTREEINDEAINFRDYWLEATGKSAVRLGWSRTWQRRCRDVVKLGYGVRSRNSASSQSGRGGTGKSAFERIADEMEGNPVRPAAQAWDDGNTIDGEFKTVEPDAGQSKRERFSRSA